MWKLNTVELPMQPLVRAGRHQTTGNSSWDRPAKRVGAPKDGTGEPLMKTISLKPPPPHVRELTLYYTRESSSLIRDTIAHCLSEG